MKDKQAECGCHRACTTEPHPCTGPCIWPKCLTSEEANELLTEINQDMEDSF